jgi:hypothetical protein
MEKRRGLDHVLGPRLQSLLAKHPDTMVIALGDHGPHIYSQDNSREGITAKRNPFLSVSLPRSF